MREIGRVSGVAGNIMSFDGIVFEIIKNPQANSGSISGQPMAKTTMPTQYPASAARS